MSRDVLFHEHVYSYQSQPPQTDHHDTPLLIPNLIIPDDNEDQPHNKREVTLPEPRIQEPKIRRSTKVRVRPSWMEDSVAHMTKTPSPDSLYFMSNPPCYKARLVVKDYNQEFRIDYHDNFSSVAKMVTVRLLFAIATANSWPIHQLDINNAYLHGHIEEELYLKPLEGYTQASKGQVSGLTRSLYELKQAGRQ